MAKSSGKASFKESVAEFGRLKTVISTRSFAPIYLLMGEESYFIDALADQLAETILTEPERAFNQTVVYGKDSEVGAVINIARQMPMMGSYQVVIVREAQQLRGIDKLSLYTQSPSPTTILVLCHKEKSMDKRLQLYKQIVAKGVVFESATPRDYEIGEWLTGFIKGRGCTIAPKALTMLTDHLGANITKISNELTKLLTFLPESTTEITADHIENNIGISKDFNNFELTKAISERNMGRAMLIADHFAKNPKSYPFVVTVSTLFSHFQRIFIVNYQRWLSKKRGVAMPSDMDLSRMLKLPNPYFLTEYKQASGLYPNNKVFAILGMMREYDLKSKGMNSGSAGDGELLRELLLKVFLV